jgi:hypothetical protein
MSWYWIIDNEFQAWFLCKRLKSLKLFAVSIERFDRLEQAA